MKQAHLTGLEPRPLSRHVSQDIADTLNLVLAIADIALEKAASQSVLSYHPRSIALLYDDGEQLETEYSGFQACYLSYNGGKPVVCCYGWGEPIVCWGAKDGAKAEYARHQNGLKRYSLFVRNNNIWTLSHVGQIPFGRLTDG